MRYIVFILFTVCSLIINGQNFPTHIVDDRSSAGYSDVHLIDFDGDNDLDIVVALSSSNAIVWYENDGNGVFGSKQYLKSGLYGVKHVEISDIDLDGDYDLVIGDLNTLYMLENLGNFNFGTIDTLSSSASWILDVLVDDINNDNFDDLIVSGRYSHNILSYLNNGNGSFGGETTIDTNEYGEFSINLFDFNNDTNLDIILNGDYGTGILCYEGDGNGVFSSSIEIHPDNEPVQFIDMDSDNDWDMVIKGSYLEWHNNLGNYSFAVPGIIANYASTPKLIVELNGDSLEDIVCYNPSIGKLIWFKNLGYFDFEGDYKITFDTYSGSKLLSGDIDGDGDNDILSFKESGELLRWHENRLNEIALSDNHIEFPRVVIFPNPAKDEIKILSSTEIDYITLADIFGKQILTIEELNRTEYNLNLSYLNSGNYFLKVFSNGNVNVLKVVKQ